METNQLSLSERMKMYESAEKIFLQKKTPVVVRIDGRAFHTFTRGFERPFDTMFRDSMNDAMKYLCENIQGCVLGYTQSDEITLVLIDYQNENSCGWFGYNKTKIETNCASMATMAFNKSFMEAVLFLEGIREFTGTNTGKAAKRLDTYLDKMGAATFDARAWSLPKEEVINSLIWRQQDCIRNSIQAVGQYHFSNRELNKKSTSDIVTMLAEEKNVFWDLLKTKYKYGVCCLKDENGKWFVDQEIPLFTDMRDYVDKLVLL